MNNTGFTYSELRGFGRCTLRSCVMRARSQRLSSVRYIMQAIFILILRVRHAVVLEFAERYDDA